MIWIPLGFRYRAVYSRLARNHAFIFGVRLEVNAHQIAEGLCRGRYAPADAALLIAPVWGFSMSYLQQAPRSVPWSKLLISL